MLIVPPGSGIVHQVNLEYLARVVFSDSRYLYPDSLVGTDSHTTMINGLGVLGWGVGGSTLASSLLFSVITENLFLNNITILCRYRSRSSYAGPKYQYVVTASSRV